MCTCLEMSVQNQVYNEFEAFFYVIWLSYIVQDEDILGSLVWFKLSLKWFGDFPNGQIGNQTIWVFPRFPKPKPNCAVWVWFKPSLEQFGTKLPQH